MQLIIHFLSLFVKLVFLQPAEVTRKMLRDKHNKKNPTQPNPVFPNWVYDRPALLGDFVTSPSPPGDPTVAIGELVLQQIKENTVMRVVHDLCASVFVSVLSAVRYDAPGCSGTSSGGGSAVRPGRS